LRCVLVPGLACPSEPKPHAMAAVPPEAAAAAAATSAAAAAEAALAMAVQPAPWGLGEAAAGGAAAPGGGAEGAGLGAMRYAFVFLLYGADCEKYFLGAAAAAWALIKHKSIHRRVLMHTGDVPRGILDVAAASELWDELICIEYIEASAWWFNTPQSHSRFCKIFTKYRVLGLTQYEKVLLLDVDLHIRGSIDDLFKLDAPAAMARGPKKPEEYTLMRAQTPVNAGVLLLRPDARLLEEIIQDIVEPTRRLPVFNSPDADYLTQHPSLGRWTSIPLEYNFQLEFDHLDAKARTVAFSQLRADHFSKDGASLPWKSLKVLHFSGAKPWKDLLQDTYSLQCLRAVSPSGATILGEKDEEVQAALNQKLVQGIKEYAQEVAAFQGLCSQLRLGEGVLWRQMRVEQAGLKVHPEVARARLHAALPAGGRWHEGQQPNSVVWIPPGLGQPIPNAPFARPQPVPVYLEITVGKPAISVGDSVRVRGSDHTFEVLDKTEDGRRALLRRPLALPPDWNCVRDDSSGATYYHRVSTNLVQWEYPALPQNWEACTDVHGSGDVYYLNKTTKETTWEPPAHEKAERPIEDLTLASKPASMLAGSSAVVIWKRCFLEADSEHHLKTMQHALRLLASEVPCTARTTP